MCSVITFGLLVYKSILKVLQFDLCIILKLPVAISNSLIIYFGDLHFEKLSNSLHGRTIDGGRIRTSIAFILSEVKSLSSLIRTVKLQPFLKHFIELLKIS